MNKIIKNTLCLTGITLVLGLVLGFFHDITAAPIQRQKELRKQNACREVFAEANHFEEMTITESMEQDFQDALLREDLTQNSVDEVYLAMDSDGESLGYVVTVTSTEGYGGNIQFSLGIAQDGTIQGICYLSISETAGLGMRADTDEFKSQFRGINAKKIHYRKTGAINPDEIDALSGATVTTNAVTNGVNAALTAFGVLQEGGSAS